MPERRRYDEGSGNWHQSGVGELWLAEVGLLQFACRLLRSGCQAG